MDEYKSYIDLLGYNAKDKITGFEGVIDSVSFDLYGCIQVVLKPKMNKDGKIEGGLWFDVTRLNIKESKRVIDMPNFENGYIAEGMKGPADKPMGKA